ncbi:MAG: transcription-repair coupling factor [Clostridia bacterium]
MNFLIEDLKKANKFLEYVEDVKNKYSPIILSGLSSVGKIQLVEATKEYTNKNICLVTYNELQARKIVQDLKYFSSNVFYFPKREIASYDYVAESKDLPYERIETLNKIFEQDKNNKSAKIIVVTTMEAIMQKMITKKDIYQNILEFKLGKSFDLDKLKQDLIHLGYERSDIVDGKGQFSVRGGILDIGTTKTQGIRIEFWGDEVDSIRSFSITSQRTNKMLEEARIYPSHELIVTKNLEKICEEIIAKEKNEDVLDDVELIKSGNYISKIDKYFDSFYDEKCSFLDYFDENYLLCIDDIDKINARQENILKDNNQLIETLLEKQRAVPNAINNISKVNLEEKEGTAIYLYESDLLQNSKPVKFSKNVFNFKYRDLHFFKSELNILAQDIKKAIEENKNVIILSGNESGAKKVEALLEQENINYKYFEKLEDAQEKIYKNSIKSELQNKRVVISNGTLSSGFECYDLNLVVITGEDFINKQQKKRKNTDAFKQGEKVVFADLRAGDYIVHKTQGIGIYIGVNTITTADGITKDYIKIKYKNDDVLYVPTDMLDNIRKFIGGGEAEPKLNRLGSKEWENTKARVKSNLREVARDLLELYAKRQNAKGYMFSKDTPWQKQFEDSFPYNETDDQLRCIEEVKKDMESDKPMDRLLCGDVGYGKTEVAIRAAFKAVMDQKQVAYLVPTTILANQQYEEFKSRMSEFAVNVELLNRFRTKKEQEEIIRKLKLGEVDVVVGTHRILSKDVEFKDLGLLIVDEEHRFGVKDKEKIKKIKENIDVLTMTATPIPRTLHMSIVGIRDMSVIYEPPQNRKPVQTYVLEYDDEIIKEAITKELERNGQVFYLFNNVERIIRKADEISKLVPEAKVEFAHGKMTGNEIESIMQDFIEHKIDVLVCTTILESGIDIPNANTIIVENADRLGLAQLYQIRGRVGRADKQGYAYITYRRDKLLSEVADKRLKAIKEFTEFGSGFKIAMRDLEIRGAGSLLGEIQSGHMEQVGYDTYCKLLDEVVKEMQGITVKQEKDIQIDINLSSYIPENYIEDTAQKIEIYQDIALCRNDKDIEDVIDEIIDRYGSMPQEVENLIEIARIKILCRTANVLKIAQKTDAVVFYLDKDNIKIDEKMINTLVEKYGPKLKFSQGVEPYITLKMSSKDEMEIIRMIKELLTIIS